MKSLEEPFGKAAWGGTEASQPTASTKFPATKRGGVRKSQKEGPYQLLTFSGQVERPE